LTPWDQIQRAIDLQDTHSTQDVQEACAKGDAQVWCGERSALVTEIVRYPLKKVCRIWLAGGEMSELTNEMLPAVEAWAKQKECAAVEIIGRHGWQRVLKDYRQPHTVLVKELG
jgi:hypothetical protein